MTLDWLVGFYEGEGCCTLIRRPGELSRIRLTITQKDEEVLYKIKDFLTPLSVRGNVHNQTSASNFVVQRTTDVFVFLDLIRPKMQSAVRAAQIDAAVREYTITRRLSFKTRQQLSEVV